MTAIEADAKIGCGRADTTAPAFRPRMSPLLAAELSKALDASITRFVIARNDRFERGSPPQRSRSLTPFPRSIRAAMSDGERRTRRQGPHTPGAAAVML